MTRVTVKANKRCPVCRKKITITAFACRCGVRFCPQHRYPEAHNCTFDFQTSDRQKLKDSLVGVNSNKIEKL